MRTVLELLVAAAIIAVGWEKSLKDRAHDLSWFSDKVAAQQNHSQTSIVHPRPSPSVSGSWMWDPKRQSILDTPKAIPSSTATSSLLDPVHRSPLDPPTRNHATPH